MKKTLISAFLCLIAGVIWSSVHAVDGTDRVLCGTNEQNQIGCTTYNGMEHGKWERVQGELKQVVVRDGHLWGVNVHGEIYYAQKIGAPEWERLEGYGKEITEGHGVICIVNDKDELWCADKDTTTAKPNWHNAPDGAHLKFVSVT